VSWLRRHVADLIIYPLLTGLAVAADVGDPGLPMVGPRTGGQLFLEVLARRGGALILAGMVRVLIAPQWIRHGFGRGAGHRGHESVTRWRDRQDSPAGGAGESLGAVQRSGTPSAWDRDAMRRGLWRMGGGARPRSGRQGDGAGGWAAVR
jgi:hypothetical protein